MAVPANALKKDGLARSPDGALYVTPSGEAAITGGTGVPILLGQSSVAVSAGANTDENVLATVTIPAGTLGANGGVLLRAYVAQNNSAGTKNWRIRFSGASGTVYFTSTATTQTSMVIEAFIGNANATNSQRGSSWGVIGTALVAATSTTSSEDTAAGATTIVITAQKNTSGDTMTLNNYVAYRTTPNP